MDRTLALPTATPAAWAKARAAQIDSLYEKLLQRMDRYSAQHKVD